MSSGSLTIYKYFSDLQIRRHLLVDFEFDECMWNKYVGETSLFMFMEYLLNMAIFVITVLLLVGTF